MVKVTTFARNYTKTTLEYKIYLKNEIKFLAAGNCTDYSKNCQAVDCNNYNMYEFAKANCRVDFKFFHKNDNLYNSAHL